MIPVTKSFIPPIEEYTEQVNRAFENEWLTNRGELVNELEAKLSSYLGLGGTSILCTSNGTVPIQIALKLLGLRGEVITTPFSYVATTSSIVWENCTPIFVDIHPDYLTIDETKIEDAITERTTCILATHVFGNSCNVLEIERIAKKHNLKVIYDAAHCFGVRVNGKSIFEYGDISTCSFHATKLFHTGEGGAIFTSNDELFEKIYFHHNFGHNGPVAFHGLGINAKISEIQSAMGLAVLPYIDEIIEDRRKIVALYLENLNLNKIRRIKLRENIEWNYSYFPVIFSNECELLRVENALKKHNILPRRYFYPSLNRLPYLNQTTMEISESISSSILCLPLFKGMNVCDVEMICDVINSELC